MTMIINCECGYVARGEDVDSLLADTEEHIKRDHPEMVDKYDRDELLALAEDV